MHPWILTDYLIDVQANNDQKVVLTTRVTAATAHKHRCVSELQELEHREKQYDGRERLDVYASGDDSEPALRNVLTFVATSKNVHWLGPASMESVAQQIAAATGPSGPNYEYLERLAEALWKVSTLAKTQS